MKNKDVLAADMELDVFNYQALLNQLDGDRLVLREVIEVFLEDVQGRIDRMAEALGRSERRAVAVDAHTIKGSAGVISANRLRIVAEKLHQVALSAEYPELMEVFEGLRKSFAELRVRLEQLQY